MNTITIGRMPCGVCCDCCGCTCPQDIVIECDICGKKMASDTDCCKIICGKVGSSNREFESTSPIPFYICVSCIPLAIMAKIINGDN